MRKIVAVALVSVLALSAAIPATMDFGAGDATGSSRTRGTTPDALRPPLENQTFWLELLQKAMVLLNPSTTPPAPQLDVRGAARSYSIYAL